MASIKYNDRGRSTQSLGSVLDRLLHRLLRGASAPSLKYLYEANHIQRTFGIDFEIFRKDPAGYLFRLPPELQLLWERKHDLLPQRQAALSDCQVPISGDGVTGSGGTRLVPAPEQIRPRRRRHLKV